MAVTGNGETLPDRGAPPPLRESRRRAAFLRSVAARSSSRPGAPPLHEVGFHPASAGSRPVPIRRAGHGKVLLFRNIIAGPGGHDAGPDAGPLHGATFYLASSLKARGLAVVLSDLKLSSLDEEGPGGLSGLSALLKKHPDITVAGLTLYDSCFEASRRVLGFLRARTGAFLAVGGIMPTLNPREVFVHLPEAHLVVRGGGEAVLPAVMAALGPCDASAALPRDRLAELAALDGVLFADREALVWAGAEAAPKAGDLDASVLDFSLLGKEDAARGLCLTLSRGCRYGCSFCASMDRGRFSGKSPDAVAGVLAAYGRRLQELYGRWSLVPPAAFGIGFYDDDFLSDRGRAMGILSILRRSPFFILFLQAAVNSFFRVRDGRLTDEPDGGLIDSLDPGLFTPKVGGEAAAPAERPWVYIGSESFCDRELVRLGKGYGYGRPAKAALALSRRGIRQAHHLIASNAETGLSDLVEGVGRVARLKGLCGEPFGILEPPTPNLVSFYPTASYRRLAKAKLLDRVSVRSTLRLKGFPEFDYPLVERDLSPDPDVREFAERIGKRRPRSVDWNAELEGLLFTALRRSEELSLPGPGRPRPPSGPLGRARVLRRAVDRFHLPPSAGGNPKSNIQLFVTRRCHLRCTYCPVEKREADMSVDTARLAADFLLRRESRELRLDFGGGEPLLNFPAVRAAAEHAESRAKALGKRLSFYMVTNAIELDESKLAWMASRRFSLELSLDGSRRDHNIQKPPAERGLDPYAATLRGVGLALGSGVDCVVVAVADPARVGRLAANFEHLLSLGARSFDLSYAVGSLWREEDEAVFFRQVRGIVRRHRSELRAGRIRLGNLGGRVEPTVLNAELMVDTDGSLHLMSEWLFETTKPADAAPFKLGRVQDSPDINSIRWSRFHCYYTLLRMHGRDERVRRVLLNNIAFGERVGAFFAGLEEELRGGR